jgi:hypothetical protein
MSFWSLLTSARKKPEPARQTYALLASAFFTGIIGIAWLVFVRIPPLSEKTAPQDAGVYKDSGETLVREGKAFAETFLRGVDETKETVSTIIDGWRGVTSQGNSLYERQE